MQIHRTTEKLRQKGFSLIEMLVVIAVIGVIAAIGMASVSNVNDSAKMARDQRNAQNICSMFNGAKVSGVAFASATKEGILDELITGVISSDNGINYKFTPLEDDQKTSALDYCEYDATADIMKYSSEAGAAASSEPAQEFPGPWVEVGVFRNNLVAGIINDLRNNNPNYEVQFPYASDGHSLIMYRELY